VLGNQRAAIRIIWSNAQHRSRRAGEALLLEALSEQLVYASLSVPCAR
jgi:hypothetical protein